MYVSDCRTRNQLSIPRRVTLFPHPEHHTCKSRMCPTAHFYHRPPLPHYRSLQAKYPPTIVVVEREKPDRRRKSIKSEKSARRPHIQTRHICPTPITPDTTREGTIGPRHRISIVVKSSLDRDTLTDVVRGFCPESRWNQSAPRRLGPPIKSSP